MIILHVEMMFIRSCLLAICFGVLANVSKAQIWGCTDYRAGNYNPAANQNDGSCKYGPMSAIPSIKVANLSDSLTETSGLIFLDGQLWSHGDSGNPNAIFRFDQNTGNVLQTVYLRNAINIDWEEISTDGHDIYVGDIGNNNGTRSSLTIYRFPKSEITGKVVDSIDVEAINFTYSDWTVGNRRRASNRFDAEAFFVWQDQIHLFSKDWVDGHTKHYVIPTTPGNYKVSPVDSLDAGCLITGAAIDTLSRRIVLTGYNRTGFCYVWLLWDFQGNHILSGNKRAIEVGFFLNTGQLEAVCFQDSSHLFLTNEQVSGWVNNRLYTLNVGDWMNPGKPTGGVSVIPKDDGDDLKVSPNPSGETLHVTGNMDSEGELDGMVFSSDGLMITEVNWLQVAGKFALDVPITSTAPGTYLFVLDYPDGRREQVQFVKR